MATSMGMLIGPWRQTRSQYRGHSRNAPIANGRRVNTDARLIIYISPIFLRFGGCREIPHTAQFLSIMRRALPNRRARPYDWAVATGGRGGAPSGLLPTSLPPPDLLPANLLSPNDA